MRKIIVAIISLYTCFTQANCNETWRSISSTQKINLYQTNEKTFFHSTSDDLSINKRLFLISGDIFIGYLANQNFEFGRYTREDGSIALGWLKKSSLAQSPKEIKNKKSINKNDFIIYSPAGNIVLNASFEDFYRTWGECVKNKQLEAGLWGNYISKGDKNYKYFDHYWKGFMVRSSNINYEQSGSDFDTYRITTISVTNDKYMTSRGIYVGMSNENVRNAYGEPSSENQDLKRYTLNNLTLDFTLENNIIKTISMDEGML